MNRKTFANDISDAQERDNKKFKIAKMEQTALKSVIGLHQSPHLDLVHLLNNNITKECTSLFNAKGIWKKNGQISITTELGHGQC